MIFLTIPLLLFFSMSAACAHTDALRSCEKSKEEWREQALQSTANAHTLIQALKTEQHLGRGRAWVASGLTALGCAAVVSRKFYLIKKRTNAFPAFRSNKDFYFDPIFCTLLGIGSLFYWHKTYGKFPESFDCSKIEESLKKND